MDFNAFLEPVIAFFSDGIGAVLANIARLFYELLYPANAEAPSAHTGTVAGAAQAAKNAMDHT
ncbi:hypothetical protein CPHO_11755 [Corynebacterium phocae]|uniref:Uncharacterized protein n=1 Tax=Corynebacterium phocae TaxID=161895 RepID=A0A1L7D5R6_9CORY|nr:hypothetical protein [Corynebacterium phocae]APT93455.1 hypothetical protein CPHO_11755 [Corynebacterium phocae]KAA8721149.1 hypothetical protein F4V58_11225 [Corynebacterium phocae]